MSAVTAIVLSQGQAMDATWEIVLIDIRRQVNRIPHAELHLLDGDAARQRFRISDDVFFEPGAEIEIRLRYEGGEDETVFQGLVVRQAVEAGRCGSGLRVELKDAAVKLDGPRKSCVYREKSDADVVGTLAEHVGLELGTVEATEPVHPELVQHAATDWDFMLARADACGRLVVAHDGELSFAEFHLDDPPRHTFEWGIDEVYEFEIEADASTQRGSFESSAWSVPDQERTPPTSASDIATTQGNLDGGTLAAAFGFDSATLQAPAVLDPAELQAWADGRLLRSRMALLRGRLAVPGFAAIRLLDSMEVAGIGGRWNGPTLVTGVRHRVDARGWRTDVQLGLSPEQFSRRPGVNGAPAAGLLPAVRGLQIGVVAPFEDDPDQELRIRVALPGLVGDDAVVWARLAAPDAGAGRGFFFRPEPGDEVVVGFLGDDPRQGVVLGSLHSSQNSAPEGFGVDEENAGKGLVTRQGTRIAFTDGEKASLVLETAQGNRIVVDDEAETLELTDQHGNAVTLSADGVEIKSAKDLILDGSAGNVEIKGQQVEVK